MNIPGIRVVPERTIQIGPNKFYTASIVLSGLYTYSGNYGKPTKTVATKKGDVVFNFDQTDMSSTRTSSAEGQIPQIFFVV